MRPCPAVGVVCKVTCAPLENILAFVVKDFIGGIIVQYQDIQRALPSVNKDGGRAVYRKNKPSFPRVLNVPKAGSIVKHCDNRSKNG